MLFRAGVVMILHELPHAARKKPRNARVGLTCVARFSPSCKLGSGWRQCRRFLNLARYYSVFVNITKSPGALNFMFGNFFSNFALVLRSLPSSRDITTLRLLVTGNWKLEISCGRR